MFAGSIKPAHLVKSQILGEGHFTALTLPLALASSDTNLIVHIIHPGNNFVLPLQLPTNKKKGTRQRLRQAKKKKALGHLGVFVRYGSRAASYK